MFLTPMNAFMVLAFAHKLWTTKYNPGSNKEVKNYVVSSSRLNH